jgi:hypothetical protein
MVTHPSDKAPSRYIKLSTVDYEVFDPAQENEMCALSRRFLREVPEVFDAVKFRPAINWFLENKVRQLNTLTSEQLLSHYSGGKLKRYVRAYDNLCKSGLEMKHFAISSFVKKERVKEISNYPRMVHHREYEAIFELLRYIKPLEQKVFQYTYRLNGFESIGRVVAKGRNGNQRFRDVKRKWEGFNNPVCLSLDCSSFELHVDIEYLKMENEIVRAFYAQDSKLKWMLDNMLLQSGSTGNGVQWSRDGGRVSGDAHTGFGNTLSMVICIIGLALEFPNVKIDMYSDGDDTLLFLEKDALTDAQVIDHFSSFGHELRLDAKSENFSDIVFCQHKFADGFLVRSPLLIVEKALVILQVMPDDELYAHLAALGTCIEAAYGTIPELDEFIKTMKSFGNAKITQDMLWEYNTNAGRLDAGVIFDYFDYDQSLLDSYVDNLMYISNTRPQSR